MYTCREFREPGIGAFVCAASAAVSAPPGVQPSS